ncbi:MAG: helix-turn-helix transcriptional regulator, partial [Oscillospiraceae bacterium]|nr:helix-turn-helix transcriptional regulator [Oscillospiraceae bacterium]
KVWNRSATSVRYSYREGKRRMERAAALLRETDESVGEIAAEIGYSNAGRFSELFKREYGDTPLQYRMRQRGK